jgi:hypothetical protein
VQSINYAITAKSGLIRPTDYVKVPDRPPPKADTHPKIHRFQSVKPICVILNRSARDRTTLLHLTVSRSTALAPVMALGRPRTGEQKSSRNTKPRSVNASADAMTENGGSRGTAPFIHNMGAKWK